MTACAIVWIVVVSSLADQSRKNSMLNIGSTKAIFVERKGLGLKKE